MRSTLFVLAAVAGCGDNLRPPADADIPSSFEIVGHSDLGARGMNSALAVAGDTVYVGSRIDSKPILIVDIANPAAPAVIGELPGIPGMSSRELRAVARRDLLVVMYIDCSPDLHGCTSAPSESESLKLYDIRDRKAPVLLASYPVTGSSAFFPRGPHEFYLRDDGSRVRLFVAAPGAKPSLEIVDVTDPSTPQRFVVWDARDHGLMTTGADDILHSVSVSLDGRHAYLSHQLGGLLVADVSALPAVTLLTPGAQALDWAPPGSMGPHSAVPVPNRDVLIVTEEIYPPPYGTGCPWGHLRTVDISDPTTPRLLAELRVAENDPALCTMPHPRTSYTAHNATATRNLSLVTWYGAGLQAIDLSNPAAPRFVAELRPTPLPSVAVEDPGLGAVAVEMWSYPVIAGGLIYVVDVRNGLYILRYQGLHEREVTAQTFLEGNSNL
jgi:hypothetical protein